MLKSKEITAGIAQNCKDLLVSLGSGGGNSLHRRTLAAAFANGLPTTCVARELDIPEGYLRLAQHHARADAKANQLPALFAAGHSSSKVVQRGRSDKLDTELIAFFRRKTIEPLQSKGRNTKTVVLPMTRKKLMRELYIEYPALVRDYRDRLGIKDEVLMKKSSLSKLEADILSAQWMLAQPGFSGERERSERALIFDVRAHSSLAARRTLRHDTARTQPRGEPLANELKRTESIFLDVVPVSGASGPSFLRGALPSLHGQPAAKFQPTRWEMRAPTDDTFFRALAANDLPFTTNYNPTTCPIHDSGPANEAMLAAAVSRQGVLMADRDAAASELAESPPAAAALARRRRAIATELADLKTRVVRLTQKVLQYKTHLEQYRVCREAVKEEERKVRPGQMVMYRDFVNQHTSKGNKVNSLVLVFLYREAM